MSYRTKPNYLARRDLGRCVRCRYAATHGVRCEVCAHINREQSRARYTARKEATV